MSRYDGLIIPRSYNEYINKSDPLTLAQALQQNNVLSGAVAAGDNKAVKSGAVAAALAKYPNAKYYSTVQTQALNCNNIEDRVALVTPSTGYASLNYPAGELLFVITSKNSGEDGFQKAISYTSNREWNRIMQNGVWGDWYEIATTAAVATALGSYREYIKGNVLKGETVEIQISAYRGLIQLYSNDESTPALIFIDTYKPGYITIFGSIPSYVSITHQVYTDKVTITNNTTDNYRVHYSVL